MLKVKQQWLNRPRGTKYHHASLPRAIHTCVTTLSLQYCRNTHIYGRHLLNTKLGVHKATISKLGYGQRISVSIHISHLHIGLALGPLLLSGVDVGGLVLAHCILGVCKRRLRHPLGAHLVGCFLEALLALISTMLMCVDVVWLCGEAHSGLYGFVWIGWCFTQQIPHTAFWPRWR